MRVLILLTLIAVLQYKMCHYVVVLRSSLTLADDQGLYVNILLFVAPPVLGDLHGVLVAPPVLAAPGVLVLGSSCTAPAPPETGTSLV